MLCIVLTVTVKAPSVLDGDLLMHLTMSVTHDFPTAMPDLSPALFRPALVSPSVLILVLKVCVPGTLCQAQPHGG